MKTKKELSKLVETTNTQKNDKVTIKKIADRQTSVKDKNFIYKFQLDETKLTDKEAKKKRNKLRRNLTLIVNQIILDNVKKQNLDNVKNFINFYKENYILNDFTLKSLTNSNEQSKVEDFNKILELTKIYLSKNKK